MSVDVAFYLKLGFRRDVGLSLYLNFWDVGLSVYLDFGGLGFVSRSWF